MPVRSKPRDYFFRDFDAALLHEIGTKYQMGPAEAVCPILLDGGTACLLEVRSETSRKAVLEHGTDRYFLKQIPWYCDTEPQIRTSHAIQRGLFERGLPVPAILPALSGDSYVTVAGARFALFEYVSGRRYSDSVRHLEAAAAALATMHDAALTAPDAPRETPFSLAGAHIDLLAAVSTQSRSNSPALESLLVDARAALADAEANGIAAGFAALREAVTHGDFNPWNLIFGADDAVAAIVDFDNSDVGSRLHDLAEAIVTFCVLSYRDDTTNFAADPLRAMYVARVRCFMRSYQRRGALRPDELACLPWAIRSTLIELACLGLLRGDFAIDAARRLISFPVESLPLDEA